MCSLSLGAPLAVAQDAASPAKPCALPKTARSESERPTVDLFATLVAAGDSGDVPPIYLATLLQETQLLFTAPDTITELSDGQLSVWLHADGRLTNPLAADTVLPRELARAMSVAIDSAWLSCRSDSG